jgi:hypothetical protein
MSHLIKFGYSCKSCVFRSSNVTISVVTTTPSKNNHKSLKIQYSPLTFANKRVYLSQNAVH